VLQDAASCPFSLAINRRLRSVGLHCSTRQSELFACPCTEVQQQFSTCVAKLRYVYQWRGTIAVLCSIPMRRVTVVDWEPGVGYRTEYNDGAARWCNRAISTRVPVGTEIFFFTQRSDQPPVHCGHRGFPWGIKRPRRGINNSLPSRTDVNK